jgi:hypothetical protein
MEFSLATVYKLPRALFRFITHFFIPKRVSPIELTGMDISTIETHVAFYNMTDDGICCLAHSSLPNNHETVHPPDLE